MGVAKEFEKDDHFVFESGPNGANQHAKIWNSAIRAPSSAREQPDCGPASITEAPELGDERIRR